MNFEEKEFRIVLTEPMLGTVPKNREVYSSYIASKVPPKEVNTGIKEEEIETVQEIEESGWTGFHSDEDGIFIYNYMVKGSLKSCLENLMAGTAVNKIPAYKKWMDRFVFVKPRRIRFYRDISGSESILLEPDSVMERPIRMMTTKGERTSVCRSDIVEAGVMLKFSLIVFQNDKKITMPVLEQCLEYGSVYGLGQWRGSGGYGTFEVVVK